MILVTGATGKVGRHLVAGLPASAEVVPFDPGRPETIEAALSGTEAIFLNATAIGSVLAPFLAYRRDVR